MRVQCPAKSISEVTFESSVDAPIPPLISGLFKEQLYYHQHDPVYGRHNTLSLYLLRLFEGCSNFIEQEQFISKQQYREQTDVEREKHREANPQRQKKKSKYKK